MQYVMLQFKFFILDSNNNKNTPQPMLYYNDNQKK